MISGSLMLMCSTGTQASLSPSDSASQREIRSLLEKWSQDFNAKRTSQVCNLFSQDLIARYPNAPDRDYEAMCHHLKEVIHSQSKTYHYDAPKIEEILISGDLAVVRLIWTLKTTDRIILEDTKIQEVGIDVFKRQNDGKWKIAISYTYEQA